MKNLQISNSESIRFNAIYENEIDANVTNENIKRVEPDGGKQMAKEIVDLAIKKGFMVEKEDCRYQINVQEVLSSTTISSADVLNVVLGSMTLTDAISQAEKALFEERALESSTVHEIARLLMQTLTHERPDRKTLDEVAGRFGTVQVYSFSHVRREDPVSKDLFNTVFRNAYRMSEEFTEYDFFLSWRLVDIIAMSYGISNLSCYSAGGLFSHAPFVLSTIQEVYVGYSTTSNSDQPVPMRRSRFFGLSSPDMVFQGRLYGKAGIKLLMGLIAASVLPRGTHEHGVGHDRAEALVKGISGGGPSVSFSALFPADGYTYTCDSSNKTVDFIVRKLQLHRPIHQKLRLNANIVEVFETDYFTDQVYYICPDCGDRMEYDSASMEDVSHTLSCCQASGLCDDCGDRVHPDELTVISCNDNTVCGNCLGSSDYYYCEYCEEWHDESLTPSTLSAEDDSVCEYAFSEMGLVLCDECGKVINPSRETVCEGSGGEDLCESCKECEEEDEDEE